MDKTLNDLLPGFSEKGIYFVSLGGAEEVGFNMYAYIVDGKIIVIDCGYGFLNDDFPGMELGFADGSFLENYQDQIEGLFITHGHEDHFGAVAHIWPKLQCPIYATEFTAGHVSRRLAEYKLEGLTKINVIRDGEHIKLNNFDVEFVSLVHSAPQNTGLIIRTIYGNVVHATDWRFDDGKMDILFNNHQSLEQVAQEGVALYVGDSTNMASSELEPTETEVRKSLINLLPTLNGTVVATCFSSNIMRMESLFLAAEAAGRTPVVAGMSLMQNLEIAKECGFLKNCPNYIEAKDAREIPLDKILYICAGSQGNYKSTLTRIANGENKDIQLGKGDAIIFSSKIIPGNEVKIERMQEKLRDAGVDVISSEEYLVHASGHATPQQIKEMYKLIKPAVIIPVHGEKRNIRSQKRLAQECGIQEVLIARNGEVVNIFEKKAKMCGVIPTGMLGVDRKQITDLASQLVKNRKRIAYNCSLFISVVFSEDWQLEDLQISSIDILEEGAFNDLRDKIISETKQEINDLLVKHDYKIPQVKEHLSAKIRKKIYNATDIKPLVFFHFCKLGDN